jgi:hypothetical protein
LDLVAVGTSFSNFSLVLSGRSLNAKASYPVNSCGGRAP